MLCCEGGTARYSPVETHDRVRDGECHSGGTGHGCSWKWAGLGSLSRKVTFLKEGLSVSLPRNHAQAETCPQEASHFIILMVEGKDFGLPVL